MKKILFLLVVISFSTMLSAQTDYKVPRLTKTAISNTGCFTYLPASSTPRKFELTYSQDSAKVYTGDFEDGAYHFAVIVVKLNEKLPTYEQKESMLVGYLDYLQTAFEIKKSAGYGKGHLIVSSPNATGIIDYWEDADEQKYAIKGWIDDNTIAVLMLYGPKEYPNFNVQQMFLDGFRFK